MLSMSTYKRTESAATKITDAVPPKSVFVMVPGLGCSETKEGIMMADTQTTKYLPLVQAITDDPADSKGILLANYSLENSEEMYKKIGADLYESIKHIDVENLEKFNIAIHSFGILAFLSMIQYVDMDPKFARGIDSLSLLEVYGGDSFASLWSKNGYDARSQTITNAEAWKNFNADKFNKCYFYETMSKIPEFAMSTAEMLHIIKANTKMPVKKIEVSLAENGDPDVHGAFVRELMQGESDGIIMNPNRKPEDPIRVMHLKQELGLSSITIIERANHGFSTGKVVLNVDRSIDMDKSASWAIPGFINTVETIQSALKDPTPAVKLVPTFGNN